MSWRRQKEDTLKLEDFLTQYEEDLWSIKGKQSLTVKKGGQEPILAAAEYNSSNIFFTFFTAL